MNGRAAYEILDADFYSLFTTPARVCGHNTARQKPAGAVAPGSLEGVIPYEM